MIDPQAGKALSTQLFIDPECWTGQRSNPRPPARLCDPQPTELTGRRYYNQVLTPIEENTCLRYFENRFLEPMTTLETIHKIIRHLKSLMQVPFLRQSFSSDLSAA